MCRHIKPILQVIILATAMLVSSSHFTVLETQQMFRYFLSSSYHWTKLQLSGKNISTPTLLKFQFLPWGKSKVQTFFFFLFLFSPYHTVQKGNQATWQYHAHISACCLVQTLYCQNFSLVQVCETHKTPISCGKIMCKRKWSQIMSK